MRASGIAFSHQHMRSFLCSDLMKLIRQQGRIFVAALPQESVIANMARRVLKLIREEYDTLQAVHISWQRFASCV